MGRSEPKHVLGLIGLVVVALLACKRGKSDQSSSTQSTPATSADAGAVSVGAAYEQKLAPVFAAIEKVGHSLPPRMSRGYLKLDSSKVLGDTAEFIQADEMSDLAYPPLPTQGYRVGGTGLFLSCARIVRKNDTSVTDPKDKLERCVKAEYLVVIRTKKFDKPESHNGLQFIGGKVDGDVLIYSLPAMTLLGGFPYSAESSKQVREGEIDKDMQENWAKAMNDGLKKLQPSAKLIFGF